MTNFLILIAFTLLLPGCGEKPKQDSKINVAYIDGSPISRKALDTEMKRLSQRFYINSMSEKQRQQMKKEVLDILIGGKLLYKASKQKGITVTAQEIKEELAKTKKEYPDTKKFKNDFTEADIRQKLAVEKFISLEFADKTTITDKGSKKYYQDHLADFTRPPQVKVSHILIKVAEDAAKKEKNAALKKIKQIQEKLKNGADFSEMARKFSEDRSKDNGGNLGYVIKGQMVKSFEDAAFGLKKGEISDIVTTKFGYHLIKVADKKPIMVVPYKDVEVKLKNYLKERAIQEKIAKFIKERRQKADIKIYL